MSTAAQPDRFVFLHIDLNSFFASVEQQLHPEYRGRPLAVVPTMADTTCCIAASYEAKALKIKTGTQVGEAKRLCPEIILIEGNHTEYAKYSHAIGEAPNRYLAKIASDMQKPDGLIGLLPSQLPRAIAHLELRDLPGVGARTEVRLNAKGIHTMAELLALDRNAMHALWDSVWGDRLYHWLRGANTGDDGAPVASDLQKSLGHSHVLGPEHRSQQGSWAVAHKLLHKAAMRLRMEKFCA